MFNDTNAKNIFIEINETFVSMRIPSTDIVTIETLLRSLKSTVNEGTPISLKQICNNLSSRASKIISKILFKEKDIERCIDDTKHLLFMINKQMFWYK